MYYQEIVISPDIFQKISDAFNPRSNIDLDLRSYKDNLSNKCLLVDENNKLLDEVKIIIKNSNEFARYKLAEVLSLFNNRTYQKSLSRKIFSKEEIINIILCLANISTSKIINSESLELKVETRRNHLDDVEILDFENFIEPQEPSKIFAHKKVVRKKQGERFQFEEYLKPYLQCAENVTINDRYLRIKDGGFVNLLKIIKLCEKLKHLTIHTILREGNLKDKFDISVSDFNSEIKKIAKINIEIKSTNKAIGKNRFLRTEDYLIEIEPGFDFVDNEYVAKNNPVIIHFSKIS